MALVWNAQKHLLGIFWLCWILSFWVCWSAVGRDQSFLYVEEARLRWGQLTSLCPCVATQFWRNSQAMPVMTRKYDYAILSHTTHNDKVQLWMSVWPWLICPRSDTVSCAAEKPSQNSASITVRPSFFSLSYGRFNSESGKKKILIIGTTSVKNRTLFIKSLAVARDYLEYAVRRNSLCISQICCVKK